MTIVICNARGDMNGNEFGCSCSTQGNSRNSHRVLYIYIYMCVYSFPNLIRPVKTYFCRLANFLIVSATDDVRVFVISWDEHLCVMLTEALALCCQPW